MKIPPTMPPREEWITLSRDVVDRMVKGSRMRDGHGGRAVGAESTSGYAGHNGISRRANLLGDLAEAIYSETTGLEMETRVSVGGFKGDDFPDGINVKATPYIHERCCLLVNPGIEADRLPSRGYALVAVAKEGEGVVGCILGWASNAEVEAAKSLDVGHGPKLSIHHTKLHRPSRWLQLGAFKVCHGRDRPSE